MATLSSTTDPLELAHLAFSLQAVKQTDSVSEVLTTQDFGTPPALKTFQTSLIWPETIVENDNPAALLPKALQRDNNLISTYQKYLTDPGDNSIACEFGSQLRKAQMPFEAQLVFRRHLKQSPSDGEALRNLSALLRDHKLYDAGLTVVTYMISKTPDDPWGHIQKGNILAHMERSDEAIAAYEKAISLQPDIPGAYSALARQLTLQSQYEEAEKNLHLALHDDPGDSHTIESLADLYRRTGRHGLALIWYQRAVSFRETSRSLKTRLAHCCFKREFWAEGRKALKSTLPGNMVQPEWDSEPRELNLYNAEGDLDGAGLAGLLIASELANQGWTLNLSGAESMFPLISIPEDKLKNTPSALDQDALPLEDLTFWTGFPQQILKPCLKHVPTFRTFNEGKIAFVHGKTTQLPWPDLEKIRKLLSPELEQMVIYTDARNSVIKTCKFLKTVSLVITDDSLTAISAAACGCASIVLLPIDTDWWWADREQASPYAENQTLIRIPHNVQGRALFETLKNAVLRKGIPARTGRPLALNTDVIGLDVALDSLPAPPLKSIGNIQDITALQGGTRNNVYRISGDQMSRVYRMGRYPPPRKGFYEKEISNMRIAADAGIAPPVFFADPLDGSMLIDFVDGDVMRSRSLREKQNAVSAAHLFRRLHRLPGFKDSFDIYSKVRRNQEYLVQKKSLAFTRRTEINNLMVRVIKILAANKVPFYATHNDPLTRNFILAHDRMYLIDWECSGLGDPHWDVAAMAAQAGFDEDVWHAFLVAYFGRENHPGMCRIPLLEALCRYYWWSDALYTGVRHPDDPSWQDTASQWWGWLTDIITAKGFERALNAASQYSWSPDDSPAVPDEDDGAVNLMIR